MNGLYSINPVCSKFFSLIRPKKNIGVFTVCRPTLFYKASGDSFEIGDGQILIYSSIGVQNSII